MRRMCQYTEGSEFLMRRNGILMHISSLPSAYGIGKLGDAAYVFANFLEDCGAQVWQILPLSPTSYGDSPYQSFSVHAGNPYFIDFERLEQAGYLNSSEYRDIVWGDDPRRVDYARIYMYTFHVLHTAFTRFPLDDPAYVAFCAAEQAWLPEYALFMALKDAHKGKPWTAWETPLKMRDEAALEEARVTYAKEIEFYKVLQFWFYQQWTALKAYCNQRGISIIGDIPIYVAYDSVEVWSMPALFQLDKQRRPIAVAGCPPDVFSPTGQLWGNPLYDWDYHAQTNYAWWIERLKRATRLYDTVRIDHFRGFESYYAIPYGKKTAEVGTWQKGPGMALFEAAKKALGELSIIAEDLGFLTPAVRKLLADSGYPGMKVLQFAFDGDPTSEYLPQNFATSNCVAYTGTHDNMTLRGWIHHSPAKTIAFAKRYLHCRNTSDLPAAMIRAAWSSTAQLVVAQMQDFLDAGPEGRMNTPSTTGGNWQYRTVTSDFTPRLAKHIHRMNALYNRLTLPDPVAERAKNPSAETKQRSAKSRMAEAKADSAKEKFKKANTEEKKEEKKTC